MTMAPTYDELIERIGTLEKLLADQTYLEEGLRLSETKFAKAFEYSPLWFALSRIGDGRYIEVNQALLDDTGYKREEVIGRTSVELGLWDKPDERKILVDIVRREGKFRNVEVKRRTRTGEMIHTIFSGEIISVDNQDCFLGVSLNITEQKQMEEEKKQLEAQLIQSQKMEAIGSLASGIAHDFNNILGIILGNTEVALMDAPQESHITRNLEEVRAACLRAKDLVKQILTFSRQAHMEIHPVRLTPIIKESLKLLRSSLPANIDIRRYFKCEPDTVLTDPTQIHQIVLNLCTNAAYALRETGGTLTVCLDHIRIGEEITSPSPNLQEGHYARLSVRDTGQGIDPAILGKIFNPYFTTKETEEGTGMGLAVVHGIVKGHSGDIIVTSQPGQGSSFEVFLPLISEMARSEPDEVLSIHGGNEKILLIDDEKAIVDTLTVMLGRLGYDVTARTSSIEAFEAFRAMPGKFDIVITDQTMPNLTGAELAKKIISIRPDIPIILCTGYSEIIDEGKAKAMGVRSFSYKPVVIRDMAHIIRDLLNHSAKSIAADQE